MNEDLSRAKTRMANNEDRRSLHHVCPKCDKWTPQEYDEDGYPDSYCNKCEKEWQSQKGRTGTTSYTLDDDDYEYAVIVKGNKEPDGNPRVKGMIDNLEETRT